jgi:hypothetical protein
MLPHRWGKRLKTYESVQRWLCRFVFLGFALLPTLALLTYWTWSLTPWHATQVRQAWATRLSLSLGMDLKIGRVVQVGPKQFRLTHIELFHPESGILLANIDRADANQYSNRWRVRMASLRTEIKNIHFLASTFHERCLCQPSLGIPTIDTSIAVLELTSDGQRVETYAIDSKLVRELNRSVGQFQYRPLREPNVAGSVEVERLHTAVSPMTRAVIRTGESSVPSLLMTAIHPSLQLLGPNATFQGDFTWLQNDTDWNASLTGTLDHVAWSQLTDPLNTQLNGQGKIAIQESLVANGQLMRARGSLSSKAGRVERDWLRRGEELLGIGIVPDILQSNSDTISFEAMNFAFQLDGVGLYLRGSIPSLQANVMHSMMADGRDGIVYAREPIECIPIHRLYTWLTSGLASSQVHPVQTALHASPVGAIPSNPTSQWLSKALPTQQPIQLAAPINPPNPHR